MGLQDFDEGPQISEVRGPTGPQVSEPYFDPCNSVSYQN